MAKAIKTVNTDVFGRVATRDLVAGTREYSLPSDVLSSLERVEGYVGGSWVPFTEAHLPLERTATDEASILSHFAGRFCYDIFRNSLFLYTGNAIADVAGGLKLWYIGYPTKLTNLTDVRDLAAPVDSYAIPFPTEFHELLARKVSIRYKQTRDKPMALNDSELNYERDLQTALTSIRRQNYDRTMACEIIVDNGENY